MATDLERLVVRLEAQMRTFEREMARARGTANTQLRAVETRFTAANKKLSTAFGGLGATLTRTLGVIAVGAIGQNLIDSAVRIDNALKVAGLSGEELTRVYENLFRSAQKNAAPLESLVQLYGRASLVQKELGISTQELLRFTDNVAVALRVSGKSAQESSGALLQLSQALGSGVVRAEEFNSILEGALPIAQAAAIGIEEAGGSVAKLRQLVIDGKVSSTAFFRGFEAGAHLLRGQVANAQLTVAQGFVRLQNAAIDAARRLNDATGASRTAAGALDTLAFIVSKLGDAFVRLAQSQTAANLAREYNSLGDAAKNLWNDPNFQNLYEFLFDTSKSSGKSAATDQVKAHAEALDELRRGLTATAEAAKRAKTGTKFDVGAAFASFAPKKISINDFPAAPSKKGDTAKRDPFDRALDSAAKRIEVLKAETATIDENTAARERATLVAELEVAAKAKNEAAGKKNIEVTAEQRDKINEMADAMYRVVQASEAAKNPLSEFAREAANTTERLQDATLQGIMQFEDALVGIIDRTKDTKEAFRDMANAILSDIARMMIRSTITGPLAGFFCGLFGGSGGVGAPMNILPRAGGGPVMAGQTVRVGEHGTELFTPSMNGSIIPNRALRPQSGGGMSVTYAPTIDARGADTAAVDRLERVITRDRAEFESRVVATVRKANQSNVKLAV